MSFSAIASRGHINLMDSFIDCRRRLFGSLDRFPLNADRSEGNARRDACRMRLTFLAYQALSVFALSASGGASYGVDPPSTVEDLRQLVADAGFDSDGEALNYSLGDYFRFGSKDVRDKHQGGDQFDRLEVKKSCEKHQAFVRAKKLRLDGLAIQAIVREDVEAKGLLVKVGLPMRATVGEGAYAGTLAVMHTCDCEPGFPAFLTKDNTLRPCNWDELNVVRQNDGIVYLSEGGTTELMIFIRDSIEALKVIARNSDNYSVSVDLEDLHISQPFTWGFFRESDLIDVDWDSQRLRSRHDIGLDRKIAPSYFVTKGREDSPELLSCRLTGLRIREKDGEVLGSYSEGVK